MTTIKERRASRAGKRLLVIALTAALALALAAAAYAADLFGIRALLVPGEGRVSLTPVPGHSPGTRAAARDLREGGKISSTPGPSGRLRRDEVYRENDPRGDGVGCGYDTGYAVRGETMGKMLEQIAAEHGLATPGAASGQATWTLAWSSMTTGLTGGWASAHQRGAGGADGQLRGLGQHLRRDARGL
ncbi:MAG: hypothetical protein ACLTSG_10765 [Lachnospiraceae bacterium]